MPDAPTAHFGDTKPEVGASPDTWGGKLNDNFDRYDERDYRLLTTANFGVAGDEQTNALSVTLNPVWESLAAGHRVWVQADGDNTTGVTLAVDSTGVRDVVNLDGSTLSAGQLRGGGVYGLVYDGTRYRLLNPPTTPPGTVAMHAAASAPSGWLECDGDLVSRTTYAALFAAIGATFGGGDGSTTFQLPDLRGEFVRGHDHGRGVDVGRAFGSAQAAMVGPHTHPESFYSNNTGTTGNAMDAQGGGALEETGTNTGTETRPRNVALIFIIKT